MVAVAEQLPDLREREVRPLTAQVHRDLTRRRDLLGSAGAVEVVDRELEVAGGGGDDVGRRDDVVLGLVDDVAENRLREGHVERRAVEARERGDADEGALELTDVRGDDRCDVLQHLVRDVQGLTLRLLAEDGDAGLEVGRLDVGDEAPLEAAAHPVLEPGEVLGRDVAGDHDLLVVIVQGVERVEERLLGLRASLEELDVVDQEDVHVAVPGLEGGAAVVRDR
ncbi:hypothetical protein ABE10_00575, partial [Bacillus toyonensis]|nr:hypothetical protein [Bacillus toyonensis]